MQIFSTNIPVRVHPLFFALMAFIGWVNTFTLMGTLLWMGVIFVSILVHEYGHALTAQYFGQTAEIQLFGLGGVTRRHGPALPLWKEFFVVLNGPLAGLTLFALTFSLRRQIGNVPPNLFVQALNITIIVNLFWTVVNLLPIQPLDGGHLLRIVMEGIFGYRGMQAALLFGGIVAAIFMVLFFYIRAYLMGIIFSFFMFESFRAWQNSLGMRRIDRDEGMQKKVEDAERLLQWGEYESAYKAFQEIRLATKKGKLFLAATEFAAQALSKLGRSEEAYTLLHKQSKSLSPLGLQLLHLNAYYSGHVEEAIRLGGEVFQLMPSYEIAVTNALCYALQGELYPSIEWLRTALDEGLPNLSEVLAKKEFDHIRNTPEFQKLYS